MHSYVTRCHWWLDSYGDASCFRMIFCLMCFVKKISLHIVCFAVTGSLVAVFLLPQFLRYRARVFIVSHINVPAHLATPLKSEQVVVENWKTLEKWVDANVFCRSEFMEVNKTTFLQKVNVLDIKLDLHPEGTPDDSWEITKPLSVAGMKVSRVKYWGDSGSEFSVRVATPPKQAIRKLGAAAQPEYFPDSGYFAVIFTKKLSAENPFQRL